MSEEQFEKWKNEQIWCRVLKKDEVIRTTVNTREAFLAGYEAGVQAERERCVGICKTTPIKTKKYNHLHEYPSKYSYVARMEIAAAIEKGETNDN